MVTTGPTGTTATTGTTTGVTGTTATTGAATGVTGTTATTGAATAAPNETVDLRAAIASVPDPEVPVITIEDLGILRGVLVDEPTRTVTVSITPTYSGCPAMDAIRQHIEHVARRAGYTATVKTRLSPPWTTDWMSESGRDKLREFGIAPPGPRSDQHSPHGAERLPDGSPQPVGVSITARRVACPLCGSTDTEEISHFGSTACKALRRCNDCREPFDEFKTI